MASYRVEWRSSARRELRRLAPAAIPRIVEAVAGLAEDPRPNGCRRLSGSDNTYRVRVGTYRVVYELLDDLLLVQIVRVRHRRDAYR